MYLPFPIYDYADLDYVTMQRCGSATTGGDVMRERWMRLTAQPPWRTEYG